MFTLKPAIQVSAVQVRKPTQLTCEVLRSVSFRVRCRASFFKGLHRRGIPMMNHLKTPSRKRDSSLAAEQLARNDILTLLNIQLIISRLLSLPRSCRRPTRASLQINANPFDLTSKIDEPLFLDNPLLRILLEGVWSPAACRWTPNTSRATT